MPQSVVCREGIGNFALKTKKHRWLYFENTSQDNNKSLTLLFIFGIILNENMSEYKRKTLIS